MTGLQATITGLASGTRYEVQVRATDSNGDSLWSRSAKKRTRTAGQAHSGDVRLRDGRSADEGRLEILYNGVWGSVCDDRFSNPGGGRTGAPVNEAPALACRMMGYAGGEYASGYGRSVAVSQQNRIWLDDVLCEPGATHWTGSPATRLEQCNHAGWGLNNCSHQEDAGVRCFGLSTARAVERSRRSTRASHASRPLGAAFLQSLGLHPRVKLKSRWAAPTSLVELDFQDRYSFTHICHFAM